MGAAVAGAVLAAASAPQAGIAAAGWADLPMAVQAYTPNTLALRAGELQFSGRKFSNVVLGGSRSGPVWRANMEAAEAMPLFSERQAATQALSKAATPGIGAY